MALSTNITVAFGEHTFRQQLDDSDLECLTRFNQTLGDYNDTKYMTIEETAKYGYAYGQSLIISTLLPLILMFGVFGNAAFIFVSIKVKYMRTVTNKYLINLAIADIVFLLSAIGPKIWRYIKSPLNGDDSALGAFGCVWTFFLSDAAYFASLAFTTFVSCDRYLAVCHPQNKACGTLRFSSKQLIISAWLLSCVLAASLTPGNSHLVFYCYKWAPVAPFNKWPSTIRYCLPTKDWMVSYSLGLQTVPFFTSLVLNCVFYIYIIRGLNGSIKRLNQKGLQKNRDTRVRNQVAKMLVLNGIVFFCCHSPFEFISLFYMIASARNEFIIDNVNTKRYITLSACILSYISAVIDPIIYTAMCERYIQAFKYAFCPPENMSKGDPPKELAIIQKISSK